MKKILLAILFIVAIPLLGGVSLAMVESCGMHESNHWKGWLMICGFAAAGPLFLLALDTALRGNYELWNNEKAPRPPGLLEAGVIIFSASFWAFWWLQ